MVTKTIDVRDWEDECKENARDIFLNISAEVAEAYAEWLNGNQPSHCNLNDLGTTATLDMHQQCNEGISVRVCGVVDAATVLDALDATRHQTDSGQWLYPNDLIKSIEAMASSTLELCVGQMLSELHDHVWSELQSKFQNAEQAAIEAEEIEDEGLEVDQETVQQWVEELIPQWS